jgi:HD-GYP domain-containing protein (c-di-GMP phosphodiesterase class II)
MGRFFEARLLAACDACEAMTADRAYRAALTAERARAELPAGAGTQFDPTLTEELIGMLDAEPRIDPRPATAQLGMAPETQGRRAWKPVGGLGPERT